MRFAHPQLLWLLLVIPPALAVFFWWTLAPAAKAADAIHRGAIAVRADGWHFAGTPKNPAGLSDFGCGAC